MGKGRTDRVLLKNKTRAYNQIEVGEVKMADKAIGKVTHYYDKLGVAVVTLAKGASLKKGDKVIFKGNSTDFTQAVNSLQLEHQEVEAVKAGDDFGMKVDQKVHDGDEIYAA